MTSSLVGSEMCIRDRVCDVRSRDPGRLDHAKKQQYTKFCTPIVCQAVSYTHLTLPTICSV
eukprot:4628130-Prorocentrum_lima.AAC.1